MTHLSHPLALGTLAPGALARLHDRAREDAQALRAEAMDDFWRGANAVVASSVSNLGRSTDMLRRRLARHRLQRLQGGV